MSHLGVFTQPTGSAHCVHPRAGDFELLAAGGVGVIHCPTSNMKLGSGIAPVPAYLDAGVIVGLGTDGAGSNNTLDVLRDARMAALHKVQGDPTAVTAMQALQMATRENARALRLPDVGVLAAGKLADITLMDFRANHLTPAHRVISDLAYAAYAGDVDTVIIHGAVLLRHRQLTTLDETRIRARANEAAERLFG